MKELFLVAIYETHCHTPLCKHAVGEPEEYVEAAQLAGLDGIIFTCHNPMPDGFGSRVRMAPDEFDTYLRIIDRAARRWSGTMDVRLGLECDYFPGYERWLENQVRAANFHYLLGSVHPRQKEFRERYWTGDPVLYQCEYFKLLAEAAETGFFDCLSHPDIIKNETPSDWQPDALMEPLCAALDRIAKCRTAMELNTSGLNKTIPEMNPGPLILREMYRRSIPVVIGADAHKPERVGEFFNQALDVLETCGYQHVNFFLERKRHQVSISEMRSSLRTI